MPLHPLMSDTMTTTNTDDHAMPQKERGRRGGRAGKYRGLLKHEASWVSHTALVGKGKKKRKTTFLRCFLPVLVLCCALSAYYKVGFIDIATHWTSIREKPPKVVLVVSQYSEWDRNGDNNFKVPDWANETLHNDLLASGSSYAVQPLYQRRYAEQARFVPNNGFESGVYIRYVVDHYYNLPEIVVFVQADSCGVRSMDSKLKQLTVDLVKTSAGGFLPLSCDEVRGRGFEMWAGKGYGQRVEECWREVASNFGRADVFEGIPWSTDKSDRNSDFKINMMCCACFAVTRELIMESPYDAWANFYDHAIVKGSCVPGRVDLDYGKHETGGAFEHLAHVVFGRKDAEWEPTCIDWLT